MSSKTHNDRSVETWLPVPDFEGIYEVSDLGRVRTIERIVRGRRFASHISVGSPNKSGHRNITLARPGRRWSTSIHCVVLTAFVGPRPPKAEGCHWDDDPSNNRLENLRWATRSENKLDAVRNGIHPSTRKTHCPQEHEYTPENTYIYRGARYCRECHRVANRQLRTRKAA